MKSPIINLSYFGMATNQEIPSSSCSLPIGQNNDEGGNPASLINTRPSYLEIIRSQATAALSPSPIGQNNNEVVKLTHELVLKLPSAMEPPQTKHFDPSSRIPICCPKKHWQVASDHLPVGALFNLGGDQNLHVMSWNINGVRANDIWLERPDSPLFPLHEANISTYQGLDGSPATYPYEKRTGKLIEQIVKILKDANPDVLLLQEIDVDLSRLLAQALSPSHALLTVSTDSQQSLIYCKKSFTDDPIQNENPAFLKHQVIQEVFLRHTSGRGVRLVNVHIPGASNTVTETPERFLFNAYAKQLVQDPHRKELVIIGGDMNASADVMREVMKIGSSDCKYSLVKPQFPTNIDPYGAEGKFLSRGREVKVIDMLFASFPADLRHTVVTPMGPEQMPGFVKLALRTLGAAAEQFKDPESPPDLDILSLISYSR